MPSPEKDPLPAEVMECWVDFQEALSSNKRKYPIQQFKAFWAVAKRYAELTRSDPLIHRSLAGAVNGLVDFLEVERKRVPGQALRDAERLECLLFSGAAQEQQMQNPPTGATWTATASGLTDPASSNPPEKWVSGGGSSLKDP